MQKLPNLVTKLNLVTLSQRRHRATDKRRREGPVRPSGRWSTAGKDYFILQWITEKFKRIL